MHSWDIKRRTFFQFHFSIANCFLSFKKKTRRIIVQWPPELFQSETKWLSQVGICIKQSVHEINFCLQIFLFSFSSLSFEQKAGLQASINSFQFHLFYLYLYSCAAGDMYFLSLALLFYLCTCAAGDYFYLFYLYLFILSLFLCSWWQLVLSSLSLSLLLCSWEQVFFIFFIFIFSLYLCSCATGDN